jgi:hypothetical protein
MSCNIELDSTVFGIAPNKPNSTRCPCRHCAFGRAAARCGVKRRIGQFSTKVLPNENTGDLQWETSANYNAGPCVNERKFADAGTMGSNGKNNVPNNKNNRKNEGERLRPVVTLDTTPADALVGEPAENALKATRARSAWLSTRECHSALTAMHRWGR